MRFVFVENDVKLKLNCDNVKCALALFINAGIK